MRLPLIKMRSGEPYYHMDTICACCGAYGVNEEVDFNSQNIGYVVGVFPNTFVPASNDNWDIETYPLSVTETLFVKVCTAAEPRDPADEDYEP